MSAKIAIALTGSIFFLASVLFLAPVPSAKSRETSLFYANPLTLRFASSFAAPLLADKLWLDSNSIGEVSASANSTSAESFHEAFSAISTLDPYFFHATNYGATFLASVSHRTDLAQDVAYDAYRFEPTDFRPYFLALLLEITYKTEPSYAFVSSLSKKLILMPNFKQQFGVVENMQAFLLNIMAFAANKQGKSDKAKEDLLWLSKNTVDPKKKELILRQLDSLSQATP